MGHELEGKVAIITGAARGLGRATADLFVEEGAKVVIADVNEELGNQAAADLGDSVRFKRTDVSNKDEVQSLIDFTVSEFGGLHILNNNAGISDTLYGDLLDSDLGNFHRVMEVNLLGVMLGTQLAARHMAKNGGGSIINTSSIAGTVPGCGFTIYRASKAGVVNFTQASAIELGQHLIRVNCICPGNIRTEISRYAAGEPGMSQETVDRIKANVDAVRMTRQPLKRNGHVSDIAQAAMFLASDRSKYVSGVIMAVDGAATAGDPVSQIGEIMKARQAALEA